MIDSSHVPIDRLTIRSRPSGPPLMHQNWGKLLFMHWRIDAELLRPLIPKRLVVDTFDGKAWIAIVPFTMWGVRLSFTPPLPFLSAFHELNVRTYVHLEGVPGVWFFSLDTNSALTVLGARRFFHLAYQHAEIRLDQHDNVIDYVLSRREAGLPAEFSATWTLEDTTIPAKVGSLEDFLVERYCLYSSDGRRIFRCRVHHKPWPLQAATLHSLGSSMIEALGVSSPGGEPLLHYAERLEVEIWGPEKV